MRVLIISDIHSNLEALDAVLATAPVHCAVWNLGDTVGYAANPNEVIEKLQHVEGISIRGTTTAPAPAWKGARTSALLPIARSSGPAAC